MCGRYTIYTDADERELLEILRVIEAKGLGKVDEDFKTGEIFPTDRVPILVKGTGGGMNVIIAKWGYTLKKGVIINARRETVVEKPMFSSALSERRCAVPSTGFFEWNKDKVKYLFNMPQGKMLYMAGLWRVYNEASEFVILTAEANLSMSEIHSRMPLVLGHDKLENWLYSDDSKELIASLSPPELIRTAV